jgi:hypothetical protein
MSDKWRFCSAEVVAVFFFFWWVRAAAGTGAVGTSAPASFAFDNFLLFIGTEGGAKGFLEVFAMWDGVIAEM